MSHTKLKVSPYGIRLFALADDCTVVMETDEGTLTWVILEGFVTDFRSPRGIVGDLVDFVIPNAGPIDQAVCYLVHDSNYSTMADGQHPVSRAVADELLCQSLKLAGLSDVKCDLVYEAVRALGESPYEEATEWGNSAKFNFEWEA